MKATIWHNPRCSKSRAALVLLEQAGVEIEIVPYLVEPPTRAILSALLRDAGLAAHDALRRAEPEAAALAHASDEAILDAMVENPRLIERPFVRTPNGVRLARPPERVHEIL